MAKGYKGFAQIGREADKRLKERNRAGELYDEFNTGDTIEWNTAHHTKEQGVIKSIFEKDELTPLAHIISDKLKIVIP